MSSRGLSVEAVRDDIIAAVAEVRAVAKAEHDERRNHTADWLDGLFGCPLNAEDLRPRQRHSLCTPERGHLPTSEPLSRRVPSTSWRGPWSAGVPGSCAASDRRQTDTRGYITLDSPLEPDRVYQAHMPSSLVRLLIAPNIRGVLPVGSPPASMNSLRTLRAR
jgi:hypothetical protein